MVESDFQNMSLDCPWYTWVFEKGNVSLILSIPSIAKLHLDRWPWSRPLAQHRRKSSATSIRCKLQCTSCKKIGIIIASFVLYRYSTWVIKVSFKLKLTQRFVPLNTTLKVFSYMLTTIHFNALTAAINIQCVNSKNCKVRIRYPSDVSLLILIMYHFKQVEEWFPRFGRHDSTKLLIAERQTQLESPED